MKAADDNTRPIAANRKAFHDYFVEDKLEAGIVLVGTEVKSARQGRVNLRDSYAEVREGEVYLVGAHISPYEQGNLANHEPLRARKLLLHVNEIARLQQKIDERGYTLVPTRMYFRGSRVKVEIALAYGKSSTTSAPTWPAATPSATSSAPCATATKAEAGRPQTGLEAAPRGYLQPRSDLKPGRRRDGQTDRYAARRRPHALSDWQAQGDAIVRTFKFCDFVRAIDFVNAVAQMAEEVNHHPDIDIRYNRVTIALTTHDAGGLTRADIELAAGIDDLADAAEALPSGLRAGPVGRVWSQNRVRKTRGAPSEAPSTGAHPTRVAPAGVSVSVGAVSVPVQQLTLGAHHLADRPSTLTPPCAPGRRQGGRPRSGVRSRSRGGRA